MINEKSRVERIIEEINATNAKRGALLLVLGFACYHGLLHLRYGEYSMLLNYICSIIIIYSYRERFLSVVII